MMGTDRKGEDETQKRPFVQEDLLTPKERRMYVFGALKAGLLIALAFIIGLGAVILLLFTVWK